MVIKDKEEIKVSLCDHCFDIGQKTYKMPPEFYKLYTAYKKEGSATFACPLIVSVPKGKYTVVVFVENGKVVKKMEIGEK